MVFAKKNKIDFIETSAKSNDNILESFLKLSNNIFAKI